MGRASQKFSQGNQKSVASQGNSKRTQGSQRTLEESFNISQSTQDFPELVNKCVRYILYRAGSKLPIRKADLQKNAVHAGRSYNQVIEKATEVLKDVYGLDFYVGTEATANMHYLVSNRLPMHDKDNTADSHKILLMLVLSHVFMSGETVTQVSLFQFLNNIELDVDKPHQVFGNIKDYVTIIMVKQRYLIAETDPNTKAVMYSWGPRADHEVSKHNLLNFVSKVYQNRAPKSWQNQFAAANAQAADTERNNEDGMEE